MKKILKWWLEGLPPKELLRNATIDTMILMSFAIILTLILTTIAAFFISLGG